MSKKIKVGIIGVGAISRGHLDSYEKHPDAEVIAVCDVIEERAKSVAEQRSIEHAFTDYNKMFKELPDLQAVSICTPPFAHAPATIAAAKGGMHVMTEKPMCMNASEARAMVNACKEAGVKLGVGSGRSRLNDAVAAARNAILSGELGEVYYGRMTSFRQRGRPGVDMMQGSKWFIDSTKAGGGALYDIGCYDIDVVLYLLGSPQPVTISAIAYRGIDSDLEEDVVYDVEEHASVFVRFEGGMGFTFEKAWATNMDGGDGLRIFGNKAGLKGNSTLCVLQEGKIAEVPLEIPQVGNPGFIGDFIEACVGDKQPITPGEDGQKVMEIMSGALLSAELGREITVDELYAIEEIRSQPGVGWPIS